MSLEFPLRISVWEDAKGSVWVAFPQMNKLAAAYGQDGNPIALKMQMLMEGIVTKACSAY